MLRLGTQLAASELTAIHSLFRNQKAMFESGYRLSTMKRINRGQDDPAGMIAVETLRSELISVQAAEENASRSLAYANVADSGLAQVGSLLNRIQELTTSSANFTTSDEQREANQVEVDAALEAIDRIGSSTSIGGRKLLDGSSSTIHFNISPNPAETAQLELPTVDTTQLGGGTTKLSDLKSGGSAAQIEGNFTEMFETIQAARSQILDARATVGAFSRTTIESTQEVLSAIEINLAGSISQIEDTDVAAESARFTQQQILFEAAGRTLSLLKQSRGQILSLLGGK